MGTVELPAALPDPQHMRGAVIVQASGGILPSKRLFVRQQQALMGGPEFGGPHYRMVNRQPCRNHKSQRLIHTVGQFPIPWTR
uniref:Uncharacterized protein n=1 Tax=Kalanchoe fedtschenkoi TaxID=63787 RepID=A0A7N0VIK2_KALFE